ncbi:hypothetical protein ACI2K4_35245 [Micromonospora sp. NPDC050397]|uniref:hypothetical protein n=1 Tax=Micromonospora sp. NPDC050397 TaxID=3364279 RepID=UPI003850720B
MVGVAGRVSFWVLAAGGGLLTVGAWGVFWWLAVPRHDICAMTLPAPAGCGSSRLPVAAFWSVVAAGLYGGVLLFAAKVPERRWRMLAVLGLVAGAVCGYYSVLYA